MTEAPIWELSSEDIVSRLSSAESAQTAINELLTALRPSSDGDELDRFSESNYYQIAGKLEYALAHLPTDIKRIVVDVSFKPLKVPPKSNHDYMMKRTETYARTVDPSLIESDNGLFKTSFIVRRAFIPPALEKENISHGSQARSLVSEEIKPITWSREFLVSNLEIMPLGYQGAQKFAEPKNMVHLYVPLDIITAISLSREALPLTPVLVEKARIFKIVPVE